MVRTGHMAPPTCKGGLRSTDPNWATSQSYSVTIPFFEQQDVNSMLLCVMCCPRPLIVNPCSNSQSRWGCHWSQSLFHLFPRPFPFLPMPNLNTAEWRVWSSTMGHFNPLPTTAPSLLLSLCPRENASLLLIKMMLVIFFPSNFKVDCDLLKSPMKLLAFICLPF